MITCCPTCEGTELCYMDGWVCKECGTGFKVSVARPVRSGYIYICDKETGETAETKDASLAVGRITSWSMDFDSVAFPVLEDRFIIEGVANAVRNIMFRMVKSNLGVE